jgi:hypothetical protein
MDAFRAAQTALASGRLEEARREFTRAVAFEPDFTEAYYGLAGVNLQLARNAARNGERSDALRYLHDSISDRRRASQLPAGAAAGSWARRRPTAETLADLERLERDDAAALAWLGWRPAPPATPSYRGTRYADRGYLPAPKPHLPGPTRVRPSVVRPSRVRPSVVGPSAVRPSFLDD